MRLNVFGGLGVGKSTFAMYACALLRQKGIRIEYVDEWIKRWAYEGRTVSEWDQLTVFSSQLEKEEFFLSRGIAIITDSPLMLQLAYCSERMRRLCEQVGREYIRKSVNYWMPRVLEYDQVGRWETESQAKIMDGKIQSLVNMDWTVTNWDETIQHMEKQCKST